MTRHRSRSPSTLSFPRAPRHSPPWSPPLPLLPLLQTPLRPSPLYCPMRALGKERGKGKEKEKGKGEGEGKGKGRGEGEGGLVLMWALPRRRAIFKSGRRRSDLTLIRSTSIRTCPLTNHSSAPLPPSLSLLSLSQGEGEGEARGEGWDTSACGAWRPSRQRRRRQAAGSPSEKGRKEGRKEGRKGGRKEGREGGREGERERGVRSQCDDANISTNALCNLK